MKCHTIQVGTKCHWLWLSQKRWLHRWQQESTSTYLQNPGITYYKCLTPGYTASVIRLVTGAKCHSFTHLIRSCKTWKLANARGCSHGQHKLGHPASWPAFFTRHFKTLLRCRTKGLSFAQTQQWVDAPWLEPGFGESIESRVESYFSPPKLFQRNWLVELAISTFWSLSCGACPPEASKTRWSEPVASKVYNWYTAHGSHSWKHGSSFPSWNIKTSDIKGNIVQLQVSWPPNRGKRTGTNNDSDSRRCKMGRNHLKLDKALFISRGLFPFHSHGGEIARLGVAPSYLHNLGQPSEADSKSLKSHKTQNILWDPSPHLERLEVGPKCATSIRHLHLNQGLEDSWPTVTEIPCFELGTLQQSLLQKLQRRSVLANKILAMQFSALPHQPRATAICSISFPSLNKSLSRHCSCLHVYWILYNICTYHNTYTYMICLYVDINILYWLEKCKPHWLTRLKYVKSQKTPIWKPVRQSIYCFVKWFHLV